MGCLVGDLSLLTIQFRRLLFVLLTIPSLLLASGPIYNDLCTPLLPCVIYKVDRKMVSNLPEQGCLVDFVEAGSL